MKILRILSKILPLITIVLIGLYVFATNELVGVGRTIHDVDRTTEAIQAENEMLSRQVASASALSVIEEKAGNLGYVKPSNFVTIGEEAVALK